MRTVTRKVVGVVRWTGVLGGRTGLGPNVVVVSPHLDDGVFSLGAGISRAARKGSNVTILTVLAGDPSSTTPAGEWDARAGFATAGEAARARRLEDEQACAHVGARPVWLPYSDQQYPRGGTDEEIRAAVVDAVGDALVLVPGFPLLNKDHAWLRQILAGVLPDARVRAYVEQPYAAESTERPGVVQGRDPGVGPGPAGWRPVRAGLSDQRRKLRACRSYESQLPLLGDRLVADIVKYELRSGGESVTRLPSRP